LIIQQWAQQANSQGQTITGASGDAGAADCDTGASGTQGLAVDAPASVPEVTGVGGSEFSADVSAAGTYWNSTNNSSNGSAIEYIPETSWNDTATDGALSATGGGASIVFAKPSWQAGTGVPTDGKRDVPDISFSGSADHDGYLICSQAFFAGQSPAVTSCSTAGSFRASDGQSLAVVGGTSVSSQVFGGIVAILNQATNSGGLGNVNPTLYSLQANTAVFHDITSGNNVVPCTQGTPNCPTTSPFQYGFSAGTGYDEVTGLGSVDVAALKAAWPGAGTVASAAADFWVSGLQVTVATPGASATSTITLSPANGFSGTVNLTCASASSSAGITCSVNPASVVVGGADATTTLTVTTTAASAISKPSASIRPHQHFPWFAASGGLAFVGIVLLGVPARKRKGAALCIVVLAFVSLWAGCGGGSSSSGGKGGGGNTGTSAGSYVVTVTATSGSISHTANVAVTVE